MRDVVNSAIIPDLPGTVLYCMYIAPTSWRANYHSISTVRRIFDSYCTVLYAKFSPRRIIN